MESHELKKTNIKNLICYYFDVIIKIRYFDFDNILVDEKLYKSILVYDILYKTLFGLKPLCIRFDEANRFIRACERIRNLVLFGPEIYDAIYNRIRYFLSQENGITYIFSHNYAKMKIDSHDSIHLEKT